MSWAGLAMQTCLPNVAVGSTTGTAMQFALLSVTSNVSSAAAADVFAVVAGFVRPVPLPAPPSTASACFSLVGTAAFVVMSLVATAVASATMEGAAAATEPAAAAEPAAAFTALAEGEGTSVDDLSTRGTLITSCIFTSGACNSGWTAEICNSHHSFSDAMHWHQGLELPVVQGIHTMPCVAGAKFTRQCPTVIT